MSIILFIDPNIPDYQILKDSVKINTIDFNLKNFDYLASRIGFIWANSNTRMPFGSTDYYFDELDRDNNKIKSIYFTGEIVELIESYGQTPLTIDLITCNFNNSFFEIELGYLNTKFPNLTVNYSTNLTGNPNNGDWIMESSNENIADIYFNEHIVNYKETLDIITPISIPSGNRFSDTNTVWTTLTETFTDIESLGLGIPIQILSAGVDDKVSTVYPIGFKIVFFNTIYEYFSVSPNGLVQLLKSNSTNPITTSYQSANINNISTPSIAIGWSDLYLIGDGIRYVSNLTSKSLVIEWNAKKYDDTLNNMIKMQVKIESNGNISFNIHQPNTIQSTQPFVIGIFNSLTEYYTYDTVNVYKNQYMYYTQSGTISFPQMTNKKIKMQPTLTPGLGYKFVEGYYNGISSYFTYAIPYITGNKITEIATIAGGVNNEVGTARDYFSVEWTGYFRPNRTGNWKFKTISDDASHLWVGANAGSTELIASNSDGSIYMKANTDYFIRINYGEYGGGEIMEVYFKFQDDSQYMTNGYGYFWQENPDLKPTLFWKKNSNEGPILDNFNKLIINSNTQPFTINPPTSNSLGAFVYTSSDTSVIDINQTTGYVQVKGVGTAIITATQQAYDIYSSGSTYTKIFVQQAPTFTNFYTDPITHVNKVTLLLKLNDYYPITKPVSNSLGAFTYTSSNPSVAQVINDSIYIKSKGVTTITATQAATDEYVESSISAEFTINIKPTFDYFYTSKQIGTRPQIFTSNSLDAPLVLTVKNDIYASCVSIVKVGEKQVVSYVKPTPPGQYVTINISQAASGQFETYNEDIQFQITVGNTSKIYSLKSLQNMEYIDNNECRMNKNDLLTRIGNGKWLSKNLFTVKDTDLLKWLVMNFIKTSDYNYKVYSFYYDSEPMETIDINFDQTTWTDQGDWFGVLNTVTITVSPDSRTLTYGKSLSLGVISDENKTGNYTVTNSPNLFFGKDKVTSVRLSYETIVNSQLNSMNITPTNLNAGYYSNVIKSSEISGLGTNINDYIIVYNSNHLTVERETPTFNSYHDHLVPLGQSEFALSEITSTNTDSLKPAITYALSNESVATINGRLITTKALGTTSIIITQPASTNFNSVTISNYTLTVTKADTNLGTFSISNKVYGASDFLVPKPSTNNSTGVFTFYSNKPEIASIGEFTGIITIHKVNDIIGVSSNTVEIEIRQGASNTHNASNPVYASFTITKATPILTTFTIGSKTYGDEPFPVPHQTSASDGALIFESSDPSIASIDSNGLITIHDGGSVDIIIKQLETNKYLDSAFVSAELTINPAVALLETFEISDKTYGDEPFSFTLPKTNSNGTLTYSSSLSGVASIGSDGLITINGANQENQTVTITVGQNPTSKYSAPTPKTATFKVNKATLSTTATSSKLKITQLDFSTATKKVGYSSLISAPTSASTGAFTYYSSNPEFVSVLVLESVPTLVFKKAGTSLITFKQAATSNYNEYISEPVELIVSEAKPVLSDFTINDLEPVVFTQGKINFTKPVCTSNGNIVTSHQTYTSSDTTVATIDTNGEITILKVGTTIITVSQDAITDYYEAPNPVSTDLTITQAPATFTFKYEGSATITKTYLDEPFDIYYPVTGDLGDFVYDFTSSSNLVKLTDKPTEGKLTVEILGASTTPITITAKRYETTNYLEGEQSITLTVNKYTQTLTGFGIVKVVNDSAFALSKDDLIGNTDSDSTGEFTYAIKSGNSNVPVVSINSGSISWEKSGSVTLIATQQADLNYTETSVEFDLTIGKITPTLPEITLSKTPLEYNDKTFTVVIPEETDTFGGETFTYTYEVLPTVDDKLIAEYNFDQNKFNILNTGTTKIRVTRIESEYYNLGTKEIDLVIDQSIPLFTLDSISLTYGQTPLAPGVPTSSDDLAVGTDFIYSYDIETDSQSYLTIGTDGKFEIHQATGVVPAVMVVSREATDFYTAGKIPVNITINQAPADFTFEYEGSTTITKTYLDVPFDILYPVTGDLGDFEYVFTTDSNLVELTDKPTERKLTVEILGATTSETPITIIAKRTETTNYLEGEQSIRLNIARAQTELTDIVVTGKTMGNKVFTINKPTSNNSAGGFSYAISSDSVGTATIEKDLDENAVVTMISGGLIIINVTQAGTDNFLSGSSTITIDVAKISADFSNLHFAGPVVFAPNTYIVIDFEDYDNETGSPIKFESSESSVAVIDESVDPETQVKSIIIRIVGAGSSTISATQESDGTFLEKTITYDLEVSKADGNFTFNTDITKTYLDKEFRISYPTTEDIDDFTYVFETTNELIATIEKVLDEPYLAVKILGASETPVKITARRLATTNYKLVEKSFNLTINKSTQTLTPIIINKVISLGNFIIEKDFLLTESESSSTGDFTLSMDQSEIASISTENNNKIELNSIGQVQITATQFSDSNFTEQSVMITLNVNKIPLPIGGFKSSQLTYQFTDGEFTLEQIDELDIFRNDQFNYTFGVLEEVKHIQYVSGTKFAILGAGTNKIIITRTSEYYEETTMEIDIIINPSVPTFTGNFNQINAHTMDGNIDVKAICNPVSNSTNPVKFSSGNSSIATVNETSGLVTLTKKAGTVIISAYVDATDNFTYGNTEITLKVDKSIGNFSFSIDQQLNYESVSFDIPQPASLDIMDKDINNQPIPFVYSYEILPGDNQEKVLKIVNDKFAIDDVGSSTIRVTRAATGIYQESFIDVPVQVLPADATFSSETKLTYNFEYIDNTFELELPKTTDTSGDNSEFTYKFVSTETSITVNEDTGFVSINKAGNSLIVQVTRLATKYYNAGIINYTINIAKSTPVILDTLNETVFPLLTKTIIDPSFTITDIYGLESNSSSGFTYSLTPNNQVASMEDNVITINSLGSCEIIASLASDDNFVAREIKTTFTVIKANSTFTFTISNTKKYSDENFSADTLGTIDTSDITDGEIPFIYSYSIVQLDDKPLVATVNEFGIVNICDVGESKVIVTRQETSKYYSGTADATLSVLPGNPTFVTESFPLVQKEYIDKSHQLVKPQTTDVNKDSSLFTYTYTSSDFKIAPVNVNTGLVTFNKAGNVTITAHRAGTKYYEPGTIKCDIEISKSNPTLQVDESINTTFEELDPVIAVSNTNSGNKVPIGKITFKSDNHDVVRMQGNKMLIYGSGDAQILVKQEADANYNQVTKPISVTINKKEPTITYTNVISKKLNDLPFNIPNPKSDSLGKFTFACAEVDSPVITITESGLVNIIGLGTANIIVTQEFNQWFESKQVSIQIVVKERPQLSWVTTIMKQIGSASFELVHPTTNSSGLFTFSSSDSSVASVNGSIVTIVGSGRAFIKAHQAESTNYCSDEILTTLVVYAEGNNLSDLDLSGANLSYMNLSNFNLSNSNLSRVDFSGSNLSGANLSKSDLSGAKLHLANLINAQLGETDLSETDMHLTNIIGNSYKVTNVPEVLPFGWYYNGIIQNIVKSSRKLISSNMLDENINEKLVNMDFVNNTLANEQVITFGKTLKLETIVIPANEKQMYDYNCLIKENLLPEQTWSPSFILPNLNIEVSIEVPANSQIKKIAVGIKSLNEFKNGNKKFNGRDILSSLLILPIDSANQVVRNLNSSINVTVTNLLTSLDFTLLCLSNNPLTYFKSQFRVGNSYKFVVNELGEFLLTNYFVFSQVW